MELYGMIFVNIGSAKKRTLRIRLFGPLPSKRVWQGGHSMRLLPKALRADGLGLKQIG
jgi:hypothetical protein